MNSPNKQFKFVKALVVIGTTLFGGTLFAQKPVLSEDFDFSIGEKYKHIKNYTTYYVGNGSRFMSIKKGRKDITIQRFSLKDMKEDVKKRQVIEDKGDFNGAMNLDGKAVVFYSKKNKAFAQVISLTGIVAGKPVQLVSEKENISDDFGFKSTYGFDAGGRINKFVFKKSPNGEKLLVLFRVKTPSDEGDKIGISVFDSELTRLWTRKVTLPYPTKKIRAEDFLINNEGTFFMTASIFAEESSDKDKLKETYRTEFFKITADDKEVVKASIGVPNRAIADAVLGIDAAGLIRVTGFYTTKDNKAIATGLFSTKIDSLGKVVETISSDIPGELKEQFAAARETRINEGTQKKTDKDDFEDLHVNSLSFNADGSVVILAEQRYVTSQTTSSSSGSRTIYKYYYRNIVASKLMTSGKIEWMHILPKYQMGTRGKSSMSYFTFKEYGKHYLFYIDDFTNLKRGFEEFPAKYYDRKKEFLYLTAFVINDGTGEVVKEPILTGSDIRNSRLDFLRVSQAVRLRNRDIIFEAFDGKKNNLLLKISDTKE